MPQVPQGSAQPEEAAKAIADREAAVVAADAAREKEDADRAAAEVKRVKEDAKRVAGLSPANAADSLPADSAPNVSDVDWWPHQQAKQQQQQQQQQQQETESQQQEYEKELESDDADAGTDASTDAGADTDADDRADADAGAQRAKVVHGSRDGDGLQGMRTRGLGIVSGGS